VCLYVTRPASQGNDLYLNVDSFTQGKGPETKAFHHRHARVGWQESSPQNNFRRIIAAYIPVGEFCNHTVNYCPDHLSKLPLKFVLGLLNSLLADWYFRLGSTNAHVSHYQVYNLPCPAFRETATREENATGKKVSDHLRPDRALPLLAPLLDAAPFSPVVRDAVVSAVDRIIAIESERGEIARTERSELSPAAQPFQAFIDALFFGMAGLNAAEIAGLKTRYESMKKVK